MAKGLPVQKMLKSAALHRGRRAQERTPTNGNCFFCVWSHWGLGSVGHKPHSVQTRREVLKLPNGLSKSAQRHASECLRECVQTWQVLENGFRVPLEGFGLISGRLRVDPYKDYMAVSIDCVLFWGPHDHKGSCYPTPILGATDSWKLPHA